MEALYLDQSAHALRLRVYVDRKPEGLVVVRETQLAGADVTARLAILRSSHLVELALPGGRITEVLACGEPATDQPLVDHAAVEEPASAADLPGPREIRLDTTAEGVAYQVRIVPLPWHEAGPRVESLRREATATPTSARAGLAYRFPASGTKRHEEAAETILVARVRPGVVEVESFHGYPNESRWVHSISRFDGVSTSPGASLAPTRRSGS